ncbi:VAN3-binding protein isoform X1 [Rhododendron vialii]|uniref:VAN3-binding protein isoform X1 n=1 Tax=Rhododendron vialii TaxID=182163 RepID=UPI00265DD7EE|nr:VAN3-binding protein isoform X1 [Rhododendron vialii]
MDSSNMVKATVSEAHPDTMDFLSRAWCNLAIQAFQPELHDHSLVLHENPLVLQENSLVLQENVSFNKFECDTKPPFPQSPKSVKMDNGDASIPPWKSNDVKSWIWMQQAMHPELNYNSCFRKKWFPWKIAPLKHVPIKKWWKEIKQKRKEDQRLQRAEVHAAVSVAGIAAALAAIAAENSKQDDASTSTKDAAVASAAALVAAQCAQVAEAMGAKREQLSNIMSSAMTGTSASDILTLTAAAATSLRGAATLKARSGCKDKLNGSVPVLPIEDHNNDFELDFEKCRSLLTKGTELKIELPDGRCMVRSVSVTLTNESKVILKIRKIKFFNAFASKKESIVIDVHAELYKDSEADQEPDTCYLIVLTTNGGMVKLDMINDYQRYKMWAMTINHMLMLSTSFTKYELQFYKT